MARVVLVGGGHANLQLLRGGVGWAPRGSEITLVSDAPRSVYSGMVPGFVAGEYREDEVAVELAPLAERAGVRFLCARATRIDPATRHISLEGAPALPYDLASLDLGSDVAGRELPGVAEHAWPTRPVADFVRRVSDGLGPAPSGRARRLVVVGAGAAGVELGFALRRHCAQRDERAPALALVEAADRILPGGPEALARRAARRLAVAGAEVLTDRRVLSVEPGRLVLEGGGDLPFDRLVWAAGAAAPPILRRSGLPVDAEGFVRVRPTLEVEGVPGLLAAGDAASLPTPKAGVYAVRAGPLLRHNLRALLSGGRLRPFRPQRDFLVLLNCGDGTALGARCGVAFGGRWVRTLKDRIDRRWVESFRPQPAP